MARKKAPRSRGSIQSRGPDKWLVRVYRGTDDTGKRLYTSKIVEGPKRRAEIKLTSMLNEVDEGTFVAPSRDTLDAFLDSWLLIKASDIEPSTLGDYKDRLRLGVRPYLGSRRLDSLTLMDIDKLYTHTLLTKLGLSGRTIQYTHTVLNQALGHAVKAGLLKKNPCEHATLPKTKKKEMKVWNPEQVQLFLERTKGSPKYPLWLLLLTSGARPGELAALKWTDLTEDGHIILRRTIRKVEVGWAVANLTKTKSGMRRVSLPETTVRALKEHRIAQLERALKAGSKYDRESAWVFTTGGLGGHTNPLSMQGSWTKAVKRIEGLPKIRLYDARHTHATIMLLNGANPKVVSERLGHASVQITLDTYSHVIPEIREQTAHEVEAAFFGRVGEVK